MMNIITNRILQNSLFFTFVFLAVSVLPIAAQKAATDEGHQIEIILSADKETIMLGEPMFFSFEVRNYSAQNLCFGEGGDYRNNIGRPTRYKVTVVRDDGKSVPQPEVTHWGGGFIGCKNVPANGSGIVKLFLPHWATFESAGSYIINVKRSLSFSDRTEKPSLKVEADVSVKIKVVPYDEGKMGEVIDNLGKIMLDIENPESGRSAQSLAYIDDKRVIKYFAQVLETFGRSEDWSNEYSLCRQAAAALSDFNDASAIEALKTAMNSPTDQIRLDIASAFERSKHSEALDLLLTMQNDKYWFVRLRVAQGLSRTKSDEMLSLLRKMLKDENESVRKAAQISLNAHGRK